MICGLSPIFFYIEDKEYFSSMILLIKYMDFLLKCYSSLSFCLFFEVKALTQEIMKGISKMRDLSVILSAYDMKSL